MATSSKVHPMNWTREALEEPPAALPTLISWLALELVVAWMNLHCSQTMECSRELLCPMLSWFTAAASPSKGN